MAEPLGLGVVGAGSISIRGLLPHLSQEDVQDRVRITAICDNVPGRAAAAAEKFGAPHGYDTYAELLADPAVNLVTIATPIGLHFEQGMQAVEAGKHIHFNKTITTTLDEANQLLESAAKKGVKIVASPGQMVAPLNQRIRQLIQEGTLGHMAWASTGAAFGTYHENESVRQGDDPLSNVDPSWYYRKPGGGPLYDMTVYGLHTLTGVLGPAKRVTALSGVGLKEREYRGRKVPSDCDDNTLMVIDFGNALFAFVYGTFAGNLVHAFGQPSFFGTGGTIAGNNLNGKPIEIDGKDTTPYRGGLPHVVGVHQEIQEAHVYEDVMQLVDWIRENKPPIPTAEHARHVVDIIESAYRASETGKTQELRSTFTSVV
jgi:predicted dehydrogenase